MSFCAQYNVNNLTHLECIDQFVFTIIMLNIGVGGSPVSPREPACMLVCDTHCDEQRGETLRAYLGSFANRVITFHSFCKSARSG